MDDPLRAEGLVDPVPELRVPTCPRMRLMPRNGLHRVDGYCILDPCTGLFMVPKAEEFQDYCTSSQFTRCPWFANASEVLKSFGPCL